MVLPNSFSSSGDQRSDPCRLRRGGETIPCEEDRRCLRYAISADIPVLDPHLSDLPEAGMIFRQIYDTLVYRDIESRQFRPGLGN